MANNTYIIENLALAGLPTAVVTDDGSGNDWLVMSGPHSGTSQITLAYSTTGTQQAPVQASGFYLDIISTNPQVTEGNRLIVDGIIENARGSVGRDDVSGNILDNILFGDPTRDGPGGADILFGDEGDDVIYGGAGADQINGAEDDDRLFGGAGADSISGALGRDTVEGGAGADDLSGGADGHDTLSYLSSGAGVRVSFTFGTATTGQGGDAQGDVIRGFNNILGSDFEDRLVDTDAGAVGFGYNANTFYGGDGNDVLKLGGNDDRSYGGTGGDRIDGEAGRDRLWGDDGNDTVLGGDGVDTLWGGQGFDYLSGEGGADIVQGGDQRDRIYGGEGADQLFGEGGNDLLFGSEQADSLFGGAGDDDLGGLEGADILRGGAGADTFYFFGARDSGDRVLDMTAEDRVDLQLPFGTTALQWDNVGALDQGGVRLVDLGSTVVLQVNLDADATVEITVTFVGAGTVAQAQVDL